MYYIPGYVIEKKTINGIRLVSNLYGNEIELTEEDIVEEYRRIYKCGVKKIETELQKFLFENEMLCDKGGLEKISAEMREIMKQKMILTIMPTENCNFNCPYCYEEHVNLNMSSSIISGIKKYIADNVNSVKKIEINWFGGEPTLRVDVIEEISSYIQSVLKEKPEIEYVGAMTTNGYLLDDKMLKKLIELGVTRYQITIDGFDHDKTRPLKNGSPTLERILKNLRKISNLSDKYNFEIDIRRNILPNDTTDWYDYLEREFGSDKRFSVLIRAVGDFGGESVQKMTLLNGEEKENLLKKHIKYVESLKIGSKNAELDNMETPFSQMCYAAYPNGLVFRANGKIEKCTVTLGERGNVVGFVDSSGNVVVDDEINSRWTNTNVDVKCFRCASVLSCNNLKCPQRNVLGNINRICEI